MRRLEKISIRRIDHEDTQFLITFLPDTTRLRMSIEMTGVLEPPLVRRAKGGRFQIISGFSRIQVLREFGVADIDAFVYDRDVLSDLNGLLLTIGHNLVRPLNVIEKARIIEKLLAHGLSEREVIENFLPRLMIQPTAKLLKAFVALLTVGVRLQEYFVREKLSLGTSSLFVELDQAAQEALASVLWELVPGENRVKELVTFLREISIRDGLPVATLLQRDEVQTALHDRRLSRPQKTEKLRRVVRAMRYPQLNAMEQTFASFRRSMALPPKMMLHPPAFFEGDDYRFEIRFANRKELDTYVKVLQDVSGEHPDQGEDPFRRLLYPR